MAAPKALAEWYNAKTADKPTGGGLLAQAATYKPQTLGDATQWNINDQQTVAGQLSGILAKKSPLMQRAETTGLQQANARGLLNSSMAAGAAQDAMIDRATPIATADADVYARAAGYNADTSNKFKIANVDTINQAKSFGAQAINRASEFNAGNSFSANEATKQRLYDINMDKVDKKFQDTQATKDRVFQMNSDAKKREFDKQQSLFEANVKSSLSQIENDAKFDQNLQAIYGDMNRSFVQSMTAINQDPNMDQQSKDYSLKQLYDAYKAQISLLSAVGSVPDVSELLVADTYIEPTTAAPANTSGRFDTAAYLRANPDVAQDPYYAAHPEEHYYKFGRSEGRSIA
jgi:hypothetical protein